VRKRGTCSTSSPEGDVPGAGKDSFIHIAKPGLSLSADKAKAGDWSAVRTSALHCTTQMATKSEARSGREGRERAGDERSGPER